MPTQHDMAIASLVVVVDSAPVPVVADGKELLEAQATVAGVSPVALTLRCSATSAVSTIFKDSAKSHALVNGELSLPPSDSKDSQPILLTSSFCPAVADQYLNAVLMVGHLGGEPKLADSGKSVRRSLAQNRYFKQADSEEFVEQTDWFQIRAYGFLKDRLAGYPVGSLIEVSGSLEQMTSSSGSNYCEVKARSIRLHKGKRSQPNAATGTAAVGYEQADFEGSPDDFQADAWQMSNK